VLAFVVMISLSSEMRVPKKDTEVRKVKTQKICVGWCVRNRKIIQSRNHRVDGGK
jgi:hypothetical protein